MVCFRLLPISIISIDYRWFVVVYYLFQLLLLSLYGGEGDILYIVIKIYYFSHIFKKKKQSNEMEIPKIPIWKSF